MTWNTGNPGVTIKPGQEEDELDKLMLDVAKGSGYKLFEEYPLIKCQMRTTPAQEWRKDEDIKERAVS